jgi:hypothetical protein
MTDPKITRIEQVIFEYEIQDLGTDYNGFNQVYEKGSVCRSRSSVLRIHTKQGLCRNRQLHQFRILVPTSMWSR